MKLKLKADKIRMRDALLVDELIGLVEGDFLTTRSALAKFATYENGDYMSEEDALKAVGKLTITEMMDAGRDLFKMMQEDAVPNESGGG